MQHVKKQNNIFPVTNSRSKFFSFSVSVKQIILGINFSLVLSVHTGKKFAGLVALLLQNETVGFRLITLIQEL